MTRIELQSVRVAVTGGDEARLAFASGRLVAVLVRLPEGYGADTGRWFLETGYGGADGVAHPVFADLEEACAWLGERCLDGDGTPQPQRPVD